MFKDYVNVISPWKVSRTQRYALFEQCVLISPLHTSALLSKALPVSWSQQQLQQSQQCFVLRRFDWSLDAFVKSQTTEYINENTDLSLNCQVPFVPHHCWFLDSECKLTETLLIYEVLKSIFICSKTSAAIHKSNPKIIRMIQAGESAVSFKCTSSLNSVFCLKRKSKKCLEKGHLLLSWQTGTDNFHSSLYVIY